MKRIERLELNNLSAKVWGKTSAWKKLLENGETSDMIEIMEDGSQRAYRGIKYPTLDELKAKMADLLKEKELKDAQKAKEAEEKTQETIKGA